VGNSSVVQKENTDSIASSMGDGRGPDRASAGHYQRAEDQSTVGGQDQAVLTREYQIEQPSLSAAPVLSQGFTEPGKYESMMI
jgi:hypothetical protein